MINLKGRIGGNVMQLVLQPGQNRNWSKNKKTSQSNDYEVFTNEPLIGIEPMTY
jgi:hypothetical protein